MPWLQLYRQTRERGPVFCPLSSRTMRLNCLDCFGECISLSLNANTIKVLCSILCYKVRQKKVAAGHPPCYIGLVNEAMTDWCIHWVGTYLPMWKIYTFFCKILHYISHLYIYENPLPPNKRTPLGRSPWLNCAQFGRKLLPCVHYSIFANVPRPATLSHANLMYHGFMFWTCEIEIYS